MLSYVESEEKQTMSDILYCLYIHLSYQLHWTFFQDSDFQGKCYSKIMIERLVKDKMHFSLDLIHNTEVTLSVLWD